MHFSDFKTHSVPALFVSSGILPIKMLYCKSVACLLHDVDNHCALLNISEFFIRSEQIHSHFTRFSAAGNFYVKQSRINHQLFSLARIGVKIWNFIPTELRELRKTPFKRELSKVLLQILENEEINADMRYFEISEYLSLLN